MKRSNRTAIILALLSVVFWSGAATAFKKAFCFGSPWQVVFLSVCVSTVVFGIAFIIKRYRFNKSDFVAGVYLGFLNPFLYYLVLLTAYSGLPAQIAMVVNYLWPVTLVLLSIPFLGEKLQLGGVAGILLSFSGVAFLTLMGRQSFEIQPFYLLLAFISTFIWSVYWLLNTRNSGKAISVLFWSFVSGSFYLAVYGFVSGSEQFFLGRSQFLQILPWVLYIGIFEMGLTYIMWNTALKWASRTSVVSGMIFLTPFLALIFIGFVVGEPISLYTVIGLLLVVGGIILEKRFRLT